MSFTPTAPPAHSPVFNDVVDNNPCGKPIVSTVGGVSVAAENLCLFHWQLKNGQAALKPPVVLGA